jgi:pantoate--beta-alanine ligase
MGALHAGHLSLVEEARATCDYVVVTIFINPTQFGPHEDLARYPKPLDRDLELCAAAGVDLVFNPTADTIYPNENAAFVEVPKFSEVLEGAHRPGHFRGVTTVVLKLLNMVQPDVAYFGQKDYQQQLMIRRMVSDLNLPVEIQACATVRESDGLALSSRNVYLSDSERDTALEISAALRMVQESIAKGTSAQTARQQMQSHLESIHGLVVDYATIVDADTLEEVQDGTNLVALIAVTVGSTHLIDNILVSRRGF